MDVHRLFILLSILAFPGLSQGGVSAWLFQETCSEYRVPREELTELTELFRLSFSDDPFPVERWRQAGFEVKALDWSKGPVHAVREASGQCRGRGAYLFRQGGRAVALQAPHRFKDVDTGHIQLRLIRHGDFVAAAWNTAPRNLLLPGRRIKADLARLPDSPFILFARAFVERWKAGRLVQIHGFRRDKTPQRDFAAILSNGTRQPGYGIGKLAQCLSKNGVEPVARYPLDTKILGGTRNPVGRQMRYLGNSHFVHLELAREVRRRLRRDGKLAGQLASCLTDGSK